MKKFSLIIILFFNILPMWKNEEVTFLQVSTIQAQASQATALPQLLAYLRSTDLPYPNNRYNYSINGNAIQRVDLQNTTTNNIDFVSTADYRNNSDFNQYLTSHNVVLPPASNEYPNPDGDVDWNQVKHDIDMLRFEQRMEAFANIQWWGNVAGQEPINNIPPCEETMYNISFFEDFYEGKMAPPYVSNPLSLGSTNLPCSNQFLLGGNIIHFNSSQLANISNYNFSENSLNAVTFNNGHIYKRAIVYDVIENKIEYDGYSTYCPDDYINYEYNLRNKRGSYNYVCFPNLSGLSSVEAKLAPTGEDFYKNVPDNLAGYSFTLPDSCIVPAQPGYSVIGTNSSNGNSCQTLDCAKVPNGSASIDNCGACTGGTTNATPCSQTPSNTSYYTTLNNDTTKYYNNDTIYVPQRNVDVKLTIHKVDGSLAPTDLIWKRKDTTKCNNVIECFVSSNTLGVTVIRVDSTTKVLIKNPLAIYKVPTLYFKRGNNYNGEYGFDDVTHQYLNMRNDTKFTKGYEVKPIMSDPNYFVPWLSLLHNQPAVSIKDSLANFSAWAKKDKNGYVEFKAQINNITISSAKQYYSTFNQNTLTLGATQWCVTQDNLRKIGLYDSLIRSVYAVTNTGDTVGKLNISCAKPIKKKIEFIYVNIGTGYDSSVLKRVGMKNYLNENSQNQIFREWELVTPYSDTLDLSGEFIANPQNFSYDSVDVINKILKNYYLAHKGINLSFINQQLGYGTSTGSDWIRFAFILPVEYRQDSITPTGVHIPLGWTNGAFNVGGTYGAFYKTASLRTVTHELGHGLNNDHTFPETLNGIYYPNFLIPKSTTRNFMDYFVQGGTTANMFFYAQWILTY